MIFLSSFLINLGNFTLEMSYDVDFILELTGVVFDQKSFRSRSCELFYIFYHNSKTSTAMRIILIFLVNLDFVTLEMLVVICNFCKFTPWNSY